MKAVVTATRTNILHEQFIPDHVFLYVAKGAIRFFDSNKNYILKAGECGLARKNLVD